MPEPEGVLHRHTGVLQTCPEVRLEPQHVFIVHPPEDICADAGRDGPAEHAGGRWIGVEDGAGLVEQGNGIRTVLDESGRELRGFLGAARTHLVRYFPATRTIPLTVVVPLSTFSMAASRSVRMPASRPASNSLTLSACSEISRRMASVIGRISKMPSRPLYPVCRQCRQPRPFLSVRDASCSKG